MHHSFPLSNDRSAYLKLYLIKTAILALQLQTKSSVPISRPTRRLYRSHRVCPREYRSVQDRPGSHCYWRRQRGWYVVQTVMSRCMRKMFSHKQSVGFLMQRIILLTLFFFFFFMSHSTFQDGPRSRVVKNADISLPHLTIRSSHRCVCLVWVRAPLWPHVRQAKFCLRVCQVVFLGVLPFSPHLI